MKNPLIDRKLFLILVLPLIVIAVISIVLIWPLNIEDLLNNLIVEVISILITVLFVDWIIRTRERDKWEQADLLIKADFAALSLEFASETTLFLSSCGWAPPDTAEFKAPGSRWSLALEQVSFDDIHSAVLNSSFEDRKSLAESLRRKVGDLNRLYNRYSFRFSTEDSKAILELEGKLRSAQNEISLLNDDKGLWVLADGDPVQVEKLRADRFHHAAQVLQDAIFQSIKVFGEFGFPRV